MRKLLIAVSALAMLSGQAFAADLPNVKEPPAFAPPPPAFSWSGLYIGGQVGYDFGQTGASTYDPAGAHVFSIGHNDRGVVGGAHLGYNWQVSQFVFGLEGDVNGSNDDGSGFSPLSIFNDQTNILVDGSFRGRVGIAFDRVLVYATGGGDYASIRNTFTNIGLGPLSGLMDGDTRGRVGWTVGGGIEYALDNNWSIRAEYRYTDYGSFGYTLANSTFAPLSLRTHETDNRAQVGFSYKFDMFEPPAPVVAKY